MEDIEKFKKQLKWDIDLSKADYQIDALQNKLLQFYLRAEPKFRRAFYQNYTQDFIQFMKDKARLREPFSLSVLGNVRTFTNNNFIFTEKGWRKPSDMKDCKLVLSYNFDLEKEEWEKFELVTRKRDLKEKFYKITFSDNREIEIGENHPIFTTEKGYKKAYSLYPNIKLPYHFKFPSQKFEETISVEKARVIACLLSCGHMNNSSFMCLDKRDGKTYKKTAYTTSYCSEHKEMVEFFCDNFEKEFKIRPKYKKARKNYNGIEVEIPNKSIFQELTKFVPSGKKSHIIEIPKEIFNSSENIQREFIASLFSGDGYVSDVTKNPQAIVEYYTMSDNMAKQLQLILLQYGIISYLAKKKTHINSFINRVIITNIQNLVAFDNFVKYLPCKKKNDRLKFIVNNLKIVKQRKKFHIKKVEKLDTEEEIIYDIFVESNNNFFLNGILTHNSGKSVSAITLAILHSALNGRRFNINYICSNTYEFIEKIKEMPREELLNSCWISDEEKQSVYSVGSTAKKMKITDIQNIIAKNNLSVISISPSHWANEKAMYGLRAWGRCFQTKSCRFMLYNLQEGGKGGTLPLGCVYIPIFTEFAPKPYSTDLEKQYLTKKDEWIEDEMRGRGDVLGEIKKRSAMNFSKDKKYLALKGRDKCMAYLSQILGSEWTKGEVAEIYQITKLISEDILSAD